MTSVLPTTCRAACLYSVSGGLVHTRAKLLTANSRTVSTAVTIQLRCRYNTALAPLHSMLATIWRTPRYPLHNRSTFVWTFFIPSSSTVLCPWVLRFCAVLGDKFGALLEAAGDTTAQWRWFDATDFAFVVALLRATLLRSVLSACTFSLVLLVELRFGRFD